MKSSRFVSAPILLAVAIFLASAFGAKAAVFYWNGIATSGSAWNANADWSTTFQTNTAATAFPASSDTAVFGINTLPSGPTGVLTANLDASESVGGLVFAGTNTFLIQGGGSPETLTIGSGGIQNYFVGGNSNTASGPIEIGSYSSPSTQGVSIVLGASQTWSNVDSNAMSIYNGVSSSAASGTTTLTVAPLFEFNGSGAFTFNGAISNSVNGGTTALTIANTVTSGQIDTSTNALISVTNPSASGATITVNSTAGLILGQQVRTAGSVSGTVSATITAILSPTQFTVSAAPTGTVSGTETLYFNDISDVVLNGSNTYTGNTNLQDGALLLNFNASGAPTSNIINSASALLLGGGDTYGSTASVGLSDNLPQLILAGAAAQTGTQSFNGTTLGQGQSDITFNQNDASTLTVNLGTITRNAGAVLAFTNPSGTLSGATTGVIATGSAYAGSGPGDGSGILGPWAITGTGVAVDYAAVSAGGQITSYTAGTAAGPGLAGMTNSAVNYTSTGGAQTIAGTLSGNTLQINTSGTFSLGANTVTLNGILNSGASSTITENAGGKIVIGNNKGLNELVIAGAPQAAGPILTIAAPIVNNGSTAGSVTYDFTTGASLGFSTLGDQVVYSGSGLDSTYTGATYIDGGFIDISSNGSTGGANTYGDSGTGAGPLGNGGAITFTGGVLVLGSGWGNSAGALSTGDFASRIKNSTGPISLVTNGIDTVLNGSIDSSNTGGMAIDGLSSQNGVLTLNGNNTYSGNTFIGTYSSITYIGSSSPFGTGSVVIGGGASGPTLIANANLTGANAVANNFYVAGGTFFIQGYNSLQLSGILSNYVGNVYSMTNEIHDGQLILSGTLQPVYSTAAATFTMLFASDAVTNITGVINNGQLGTNGQSGISFKGYGIVDLSNSNTLLGATGLYGNMTLNLDFSQSTSPLSQILPNASQGAVNNNLVSYGDNTIELIGASGQTNSESVNNLFVGAGAEQIVMNQNGATGLVLNLGNINSTGVNGNLNFNLAGGITPSLTNGVVTTSTIDSLGLLRGDTVNGNDWATAVTNGASVSGSSVEAYAGYVTVSTGLNLSSSTTDYTNATGFLYSSDATPSASGTVGSLRFNANSTDSVALNGHLLGITDGVLVSGSVSGQSLSIGTNNGTDAITGGNNGTVGGNVLYLVNNGVNGTTLNVNAIIQNNTTGAMNVAASGSGVTILGGTNTYTGSTYVEGPGVLEAADSVTTAATGTCSAAIAANATTFTLTGVAATAVPLTGYLFGPNVAVGTQYSINQTNGLVTITSGSVTASIAAGTFLGFGSVAASNIPAASNIVFDGGVLGLTGSFTRSYGTGVGQVQFSSNGGNGGFAAMNAGIDVVELGGTAGLMNPGINLNNYTYFGNNATDMLTFGAPTAQGMVDFMNSITIRYGMTFNVVAGTSSPALIASGDPLAGTAIAAQMSGMYLTNNGSYGFNKTGNGTLWISGTAEFGGAFNVLGGIVTIVGTGGPIGNISSDNANQVANNTFFVVDGATSILDLGNNTGTQNETNASSPLTVLNGGEILGSGNSAIENDEYLLQSGSISAGLLANGIYGEVVKNISGMMSISGSDSYVAGTYLSAGQLNVNNNYALGAQASAVNISDNSNNNTALGNSSGANVTVKNGNAWNLNGNFSYNGTGNTLNTGTGNVTLGANVQVTVTATGTANSFGIGGAIGGNYNLAKAGGGVLAVTGDSAAYTGTTNVLAGTLLVSGSLGGQVTVGDPNNLGTSAILAGNGMVGNLTVGGTTSNTGAVLEPSGGATEALGAGTSLETGSTFTVLPGANVALQIGRTDTTGTSFSGDSSDHILVGYQLASGSSALSGNLVLSLETGYTPAVGDVLYLIINDAGFNQATTGLFATVNGSPIVGSQFSYDNYTWGITNTAWAADNSFSGGYDVAIDVISVPEPGTWAMLATGISALLIYNRRNRKRI